MKKTIDLGKIDYMGRGRKDCPDDVIKLYELSPRYDRRASFYGKAHVLELPDGTKQLKSYNTIVCELSPGGIFRMLWDGKTQTTSRHIKEFRKQFDPNY